MNNTLKNNNNTPLDNRSKNNLDLNNDDNNLLKNKTCNTNNQIEYQYNKIKIIKTINNKKIIKIKKTLKRKKNHKKKLLEEKNIEKEKRKKNLIKKISKLNNGSINKNTKKNKTICEEQRIVKENNKEINFIRNKQKDPIKLINNKNRRVLKNFLEKNNDDLNNNNTITQKIIKHNNPPINNKPENKKFTWKKPKGLKYPDTKELIVDEKMVPIEPKYKDLIPQWEISKDNEQWVIGTLNCHGLTKVGEIDALASDLKEMKSDIFIITETWEKESDVNFRYKYLLNTYNLWSSTTYSKGESRKRKGVSIILSERARRHYHTTSILKDIDKNELGCLLKIELKFKRMSLIVIGCYVPPSREDLMDKNLVHNKSIEWLKEAISKDKYVIFMGDLNEWIMEVNTTLSILGNYLKFTSQLKDTWEHCNEQTGGETYPINNPKHKIDYIYVSNNLLNKTIQCSKSTSQSDISEDHCSLWTLIDLQGNTSNIHTINNQNKIQLDIKKASKENWENFKKNLDQRLNNLLDNKEINQIIEIDNIIYETAIEYIPNKKNNIRSEKINKEILKIKTIRKNLSHAISDLPKSKNRIRKIYNVLSKWDSMLIPNQLMEKIVELQNNSTNKLETIQQIKVMSKKIIKKLRERILIEAQYNLIRKIKKAIKKRQLNFKENIGSVIKSLKRGPLDKASPTEVGVTRTRCVATRLQGGHADNALPQLATATVNCRIFPGVDPASVLATLRGLGEPDHVTVEPIEEARPTGASPLRPDVLGAYTDAVHARHPGAAIVPDMSTGATDGLYFRARGVPVYGVEGSWIVTPIDERAHGRDERLPVRAFDEDIDHWTDMIRRLAR